MSDIASTVTIMRAKPEDAMSIQRVIHLGWLDAHVHQAYNITAADIDHYFRDRYNRENLREKALQIANLPKNEAILVAKEGKMIVGVARAKQHSDHNEFQYIYVRPQHQNKGIGKALWSEIQQYLDPIKDTELRVAVYNVRAIRIYEKWRFADTGERFHDLELLSGKIIPEISMRRASKSAS